MKSQLTKQPTQNVKKSGLSIFKSVMSIASEKKKTFQFGDKSKEGSLQTLYYMLTNYHGIEKHAKAQSFNPLDKYSATYLDYDNTRHLRPELIYYLTIISIRELHDFYVDFYATFDKNKNFILEAGEFQQLMQCALNKCVGPKKFKIFTDICLLEPETYDGKIDSKMINEMCDNFRDSAQQTALDYLLLFPYIMSFFMEYNYHEIKYRLERLNLMRGTEIIKGKEEEIKNIFSLLSILREMGIEYLRDKHKYILTYRDVENVLIKFKNIQKWITFDIIKQVLQQLAKLMNVDQQTGQEQKKKKLVYIVDFLTLKLCIHQNCQYVSIKDKKKKLTPSAYLEILVLWNCAMFSQNAQEVRLKELFENFVDTKYRDKQIFTRLETLKLLERFFKKHFQMMPKDQVAKIVENHSLYQFEGSDRKKNTNMFKSIPVESLKEEIFLMICRHGHEKLADYISTSFEGITKRNDNLFKNYHNQGKNIDGSISNEQTPHSGGDNNRRNTPFIDDQNQDQEEEEGSVVDSVHESQQSEKSEQSELKKPQISKFKRAVRIIQSENAFLDQQTTVKKDYLKACLIMDSFLKRQSKVIEHKKLKESQMQSQIQVIGQSQRPSLMSIDQQRQYEMNGQPGSINTLAQQSLTEQQLLKIEQQKEQIKQDEEHEEIIKKTDELKKLQFKQDQKTTQAKILIQETILKNMQQKSNDDDDTTFKELKIVLGKNQRDYGPSNFKNEEVTKPDLGKMMQGSTNAKIKSFTIFSQKINAQEDFQVYIHDEELKLKVAQQQQTQSTKQKQRDTCQCKIM